MRGAKSAKWVAGAIVVALTATACGGSDTDSKKKPSGKPEGYVSIDVGEPQKPLIPADTNETNGSYVIQSVFTQLLDFDSKGEIVLTNAESVETEDSKTWTVKLKKGWKFHNGEAVTAQSYIDAWNWYANVDNAQQNAFWFSDIKGYADIHPEKGKAKGKEMSGLKAVDDTTFTIELTDKVPYFNYKLGYATFAPLPKVFYDDPKAFGQKPIGNGPYKFEKWTHKKLIQVQAWDGYQGPNKAANKGIQFKNYATVEAAYQDVLSGNLDMIRQVGPKDLPKYKSDLGSGAIEQEYAAIQTLVPAFYSKTFKDIDPKVLQGLSMAIDRDTITKTVLNNTRTPATSFTPPQVKGNQPLESDILKFDPVKAKKLVKEGGGVPENKISIQYNADGGHQEWVTAVCESIRNATGVDCVGDPKPDFPTDLEARDNDEVKGLYRGGWVADYPVNVNFLKELYHSKAESNNGRFADKQIDALMAKGDKADSLEESVAAYQEVEKKLVDKMPAIPLWYYRINGGHGKDVDNVKVDFHGDLELTAVTTK
ncbi:peptide ABC transporter substrate-binding protein [Streptomyces agglomeratus]|uniref:Peptide ABC transporter substrate-binding protein n=1 Tax=Streptomyces agglomeratus TaxID=285458 RepID=A0A1E5P6K4_9ACTN|nr:ABC transporter substrate-binding protein [Streptomyces agglomeratus]OEJ25190.1 peptide ABC transporter substrate-binding protein [Streptomyces agglomeratus]OEJ40781.1 peptide ABC transporter substrate-binding protein [Streptomyces agglomeratus]OEJ44838.1 peptide ABC transporter substrate-binding protein [Streptomyces agglomeratus]OEJ53322.1 peptide ABC transporter substrate-binding protein [Streptomyces agglomeratus]OEJ60659.1 peptide ABC transporter substrate-binding protein [Streptomyces